MAEQVRAASQQASARATRAASATSSRSRSSLLAVIAGLAYGAIIDAAQNLARAHIASGFGFWNNTAGFDISQTLISYSASTSTFGRAFWVGCSIRCWSPRIGIVLATVLGFVVGIARLSRNWLVAKLAARLRRDSSAMCRCCCNCCSGTTPCSSRCRNCAAASRSPAAPFSTIAACSCRGRNSARNFAIVLIALAVGVAAPRSRFTSWAQRRQERTGRQKSPVLWPALGLDLGLPLTVLALDRLSARLQHSRIWAASMSAAASRSCRNSPRCCSGADDLHRGLHRRGGARRHARRARAARPKPPRRSGCAPAATLRLIVVPQAMRVIIPPLTSQYLNLTKNSSLAVAIGYPDLVQVFTGTVLNKTGQAVEVVAITMAVYLAISLSTSLLMNLYARAIAMVER